MKRTYNWLTAAQSYLLSRQANHDQPLTRQQRRAMMRELAKDPERHTRKKQPSKKVVDNPPIL